MFRTVAAVTVVLQGCYRCFCQLLFILHRNILGLYCLLHLDIYTYGRDCIILQTGTLTRTWTREWGVQLRLIEMQIIWP